MNLCPETGAKDNDFLSFAFDIELSVFVVVNLLFLF